MRIYVTLDVKFFNEFQRKDRQQDSVQGSSDEPFSVLLLDNQQSPGDECETEIGCSMQSDARDRQADEESNELQDDPNEVPPEVGTVTNNGRATNDAGQGEPAAADNQLYRGPGRPRKILTGKPGRPAKQYNVVSAATESQEPEKQDESCGDEFLRWENAELVLNTCEIPFYKAMSGPDKDEWVDAVYSEIRSLINDTFDIISKPIDGKVKCHSLKE